MPSCGDPGFYNESGDPDAPSWCPAQVMQTDTVPSADSIAAIVSDDGAYPETPDTGRVNLIYWAMAGQTGASQANAYNVEVGTGPLQFTSTLPVDY